MTIGQGIREYLGEKRPVERKRTTIQRQVHEDYAI
jgi:hypothetical protein